jgi:hypothetical protein
VERHHWAKVAAVFLVIRSDLGERMLHDTLRLDELHYFPHGPLVLAAYSKFDERLHGKRKLFPEEELFELWQALQQYCGLMKGLGWIHRDVAREISGFREYLQLQEFGCLCRRISAVICRGPVARRWLQPGHGRGTTPQGMPEVVSLG